jgi:hypothetical protein
MNDLNSAAAHSNALAALERADMALAHAEQLVIDGPCSVEEISVATLQGMLGDAVPGAVLESIALADTHSGMTTRNKWSLTWNAAGQAAGLPTSVFVKATPDGPYLRETLSLLHMAENEVNFYRDIQPTLPELAPRAYYGKSYPGGRFMLLMEDLDERGLRPYWAADECTLAHAKAVVAALAQLHAAYWQSPRFETDLAWVRPRTRRFGFEWHQKSYHLARRDYLTSETGAKLPPELAEMIQFWDANDRTVFAYWESLPATVLHGDSHLGNTFSYPDGRAGFFDWQVTYRGHGLRDLAYFFLGAVEDSLRKEHEREVVGHYLDCLAQHGVTLDREKAWQDYCLFTLDRFDAHMKTIVRGGYGHASSALERGRLTTIGSILDNDVPALLRRIVKDAKGRP